MAKSELVKLGASVHHHYLSTREGPLIASLLCMNIKLIILVLKAIKTAFSLLSSFFNEVDITAEQEMEVNDRLYTIEYIQSYVHP